VPWYPDSGADWDFSPNAANSGFSYFTGTWSNEVLSWGDSSWTLAQLDQTTITQELRRAPANPNVLQWYQDGAPQTTSFLSQGTKLVFSGDASLAAQYDEAVGTLTFHTARGISRSSGPNGALSRACPPSSSYTSRGTRIRSSI